MKRRIDPIVMLTEHDLTVANGVEIFESCKDIDISNWGFKTVGQPVEKLYEIAAAMKAAGKRLHLEVIVFTPEEYKLAAEFCAKAKVDVLLGTVYDKALHESLRACGTEYWPFVGKTPGYQGRIVKSKDEIIEDVRCAVEKGVDGVACPAYMHDKCTGEEIMAAIHNFAPELPLMVAGRVTSKEQMTALIPAGASLFTIGGALFAHKFVSDGDFRDNVKKLQEYIDEIN